MKNKEKQFPKRYSPDYIEELKKKRAEENAQKVFIYQCGFTQQWTVLHYGKIWGGGFKTLEEATEFSKTIV